MEHMTDPVRAYTEMYRVLKPGGMIISMNVPEHDNIQRIATPINGLFSKIERRLIKKSSKPWLDNKSRSKTADVHRATGYADQFKEYLIDANFSKCCSVEFNPFPTIAPVPRFLDLIIVTFYQIILVCRKVFFRMKNPEYSSKKNSRCHFVYGIK